VPRSKDPCKQPPISIPHISLAVEAVHKGLVPAAGKHFNVACTTRDILITREVVMSSSGAVNVQYRESTDEECKLINYITTARNSHYGLRKTGVIS
jgi:hypothetical protein